MDRLARIPAAFVVAVAFVAPAAAQQCGLPDVSTYCTAGTTVHGCLPSIGGVGLPSAVNSSGFEIVVSDVPGQRTGTIFFGFYQAAIPWAQFSPSYQCVAFPIQRTGNQFSGAVAGQCNGELRLDFNTWRAANPNALGSPYVTGQVFNAQGWFRDPGAPRQTNLSNALRFALGTTIPWPAPPGMVAIPAGSFMMGSSVGGAAPYFGDSIEQPIHQVTISYCFWMGDSEVTQAQYLALMGANPSGFVGPNNPVERVTWFDAKAYCDALTAQQTALGNVPPGYQYRLPTEAEWEYACRAGTTTEFNVGASLFCSQAKFWYSHHSGAYCFVVGGPGTGTAPVRSHAPNAWGLYDMHGNVSEWCLDSLAAYSDDASTNPFVGGGPERVLRGGGWIDFSSFCRSAVRYSFGPNYSFSDFGFRVVLAPILVP
jgi:formylglycine-generating enzyme required for sulfatase activity